MLFVPFEYKYLKASILVFIILAVATQAAILGKAQIDIRVLFWCLILICTGILFVLWGILNGHTDSIKVFPVYVIWPIAYIFIIASITHIKAINNIFRLFTCITFFIAIYSIIYILSRLNILPTYAILSLIEGTRVSLETEFISYFIPSITSMIYLVPFMLSSLLLWDSNDYMPIKPIWFYMALMLSLVIIIISSRRIFWVLLFLTPVFTFTFILFLKKNYRNIRYKIFYRNMKRICVVILCVIFVPAFFYITEITEIFLKSDVFVEAATFNDEGTVVRNEQMKKLLDGWLDVPLLGAGHGASLPNYQRSSETPWSYELSYSALLFQTGLIGFTIYFLEILWIFYIGIKLSRKNEKLSLYIIPTLVGMTCFLVANGTNPYIQAFDHLWTIFVPIILINLFLLNPSIETLKKA